MTDDGPENGDDSDDSGSNGGWWPFGGRRVRELKRQLREAREERDEFRQQVERLQDELDSLREENERFEEVMGEVERERFAPSEVLSQLGRAVAEANGDLAGSPYAVDDLEVEFRTRFAGSEGGIALVLPEADADPALLSTVTLRVARGREPASDRQPLLGAYGGVGAGEEGPAVEYVEVPDVREVTVEEAKTRLDEAGFAVEVTYQPGGEPAGIVLQQSPGPFAVGPAGETVEVTVGGDPPAEE